MIAGVIASPILVLLYFLKLRRRRMRVGSTLLWQRAVKDLQVNEPFRWLKPSLLLFLQLLALACFAIALGRPAVPGNAVSGDRVILLIDRSASMNALDGPAGASRFEEAKQIAAEIVGDLSPGASVQIIAFAAQPEIRFAPSTNHVAALRAIEQISPTDQPGDIAQALELTQSMLLTSTNEQAAAESISIVLISDGGYSRTSLALAGGDLEFRRAGPPEAPTYDNLGITHLNVSADFDDPSITRLFLRIENAADREVATTVTLSSPAGVLDRKPIRVPATTETGPGTQTLTFELNRGVSGLVTATLEREDYLAEDNSVSAIITPASLPEILLVSPDGDDGSLDWVIRNTLEEMNIARLSSLSESALNEQLQNRSFRTVDLVVFDRVDVPGDFPAPTLSFAGALPGLPVTTAPENADRFTAWSRSHPIMRRLVLDSVRMSSRSWFDVAGTDRSFEELASGRQGPNIVLTTEGGQRRLGVAFNPAQTNWPLDIAFPLFLIQAVEHFTLETFKAADAFATTSENASIAIDAGSGTLVLTGPAEIRAQIPLASTGPGTGQSRRVSLGVPERAGVYRDNSGNPVLAVNLVLSGESSIATSDTIRIAGRVVRAGQSDQGHREVWHWFVIAATALLTAEWMLFAGRMRT